MLPEQQQRILGYFIEEARDHLNTIEQGLLNLQSTLNDPEMINEVFRAAHSIKGGAAMLGLTSIQHTSHRLEDCFKVLKENPIRVDQKLESLFLGVSDTLKALLEQLSGPFGLSEEAANTLMSETEPVFQWLHEHLELLVQKGVGGGVSEHLATQPYPADSVGTLTEIFFRQDGGNTGGEIYRTTPVKPTYAPVSAADQWGEFQAQVLQTLREMLQLFKQPATPATRQHLQDCCNDLVKIGKTWNLPNWCNLCKASANAIANQENTYLTLAKIVITEIKQGQELVLQGREPEITISHRLEALWGFPEMPLLEVAQNLLGDVPIIVNQSFIEPVALELEAPIALPTDSVTSLTEISEQLEPQNVTSQNYTTANILFDSEDHTLHSTSKIHTHGPEVGLAELNTLADLFEGETPELDETWQQEEILNITDAGDLRGEIREIENEEIDSDIADFLSLDDEREAPQISSIHEEIDSDIAEFLSLNDEKEAPQISSIHEEIDSDIAEFLSLDDERETPQISSIHEEIDSDIAEFLSLDDEKEEIQNDTSNSENLSLIFGDNFLGQDNQESQNLFKAPITAGEILQETREKANKLPDADDVIDDLLELSFDEDSSTLPSVAIDSDNLFLEKDINVDSLEEVKLSHDSEPKLITPTKDSSLSNLFNDLEASPLLSKDESELNDLFDLPSATISEFAQTEDDLDNFWDSATEDESEQLIEAVLQEDIAQALEESLFAAVASSDIYAESQQSISTSFDPEDLDITFLQEEEELDLIFSSDTENDLFGELSANDSSISADIQLREGDRKISPPEIHNFSQQPEALDFVPEFTTQVQEFSSVTDLEVDLFNEINGDATALESTENVENNDLFVTANTLDLQQPEAVIEHSSSTVEPTSEIELGDDLLITNSDLSELTDDLTDITFEDTSDFARVETFIEFSAPTVEDNSEFKLNDDLLITDADSSELTSELTDITFESTDDLGILETPSFEQSSELDLGDDLLITDADSSELTSELTDITFESTDDLGILETPSFEQSSELDLGADLLITDSDESELTSELTDITFESTDDLGILETPSFEQSSELDLGADLLITDSDSSELIGELTDITFDSTDDLGILETPATEQSSELDLGADLLITDSDSSELTSELTDITFDSTDDLGILETPSSEQSSELELGDDLLITDADSSELIGELTDITFDSTDDFANLETISTEQSSELDLGADLLITDSDSSELTSELTDITFDSTDDLGIPETPSFEQSSELDLGADLLITDADSSELIGELTDITFDSTDDFANLETISTEQSSELDLGADLLITDSDSSELTSELTDITFDSTDDLGILETPSS
ncbi:Hpt domain-containing protein, partial [Anabaena azotica]|uniref:Hpt domain-containing protein n=1 Tax=Anabaena azotica TaxID=197653 RepID=UPI001F54E715